MIRMFARRLDRRNILSGTDQVVMGISLPSGSRLNKLSVEMHLWQEAPLNSTSVVMYAIEAWILPVLDPDAAADYNTLWDTLVPKDSDVETLDLDTTAATGGPFYEPGEPDLSDMLEVGLIPERIYHKNRMLTMGNGSIFSFQDNQTPFSAQWLAGDTVRMQISKNYHIEQPSVLLVGVANPSLDDTTTTGPAAATENEWGQMKYIGHVLERAMLHVFGIVEAGAETPWEEATALLKKHLEPDPFEETASDFVSASWSVATKAIIDHSVVGRLEDMTVTTGR